MIIINKPERFSTTRFTGAYRITHPSSGVFYVGSASDLYMRKKQHLFDLKHRLHFNKRLQSAYDLDPALELHVWITETRELAFDVEQELIDHHKGDPLFANVAHNARFPSKGTRIEGERLEHLQDRLRKMWIGRTGHRHSAETKKKMSEAKKGRSHSPEHRLHLSLRNKERAKPVSIEGTRYESIAAAAAELRVSESTIRNHINSELSVYDEWLFL